MTTPDIRLEGAPNFRDIGGQLNADGRRIKRGVIYRSGELSHLTDHDFDTLRRLGIAFVADLRSLKECDVHRSRWPDGMKTEMHRANITVDIVVKGRPIMEQMLEIKTTEEATHIFGLGFGEIPDHCGPAIKMVTERIAAGVSPVMYHCTNGRDRTGVISAMLLYMLDASHEAIVKDFVITNERIDVELVIKNSVAAYKGMGVEIPREIFERAVLVQAEYIDIMFDGMTSKYGSPDGYLQHFGIDGGLRNRLRERLLEPAQ